MPIPRCFHKAAGQYKEDRQRDVAERIGKVVRHVTAHPLCTTDEIKAATGQSPMIAVKYIKSVQYGTPPGPCWRLNRKKLEWPK